MTDTPGKRLYQIRLACGDGSRTAETLKAFSDRVKRRTGVFYHPNTLSLLERDEQQWKLDDVRTLVAVDPLRRPLSWLACFDAADAVPLRPREARVAEPTRSLGGIEPVPDSSTGRHKVLPSRKKAVGGVKRRRSADDDD